MSIGVCQSLGVFPEKDGAGAENPGSRGEGIMAVAPEVAALFPQPPLHKHIFMLQLKQPGETGLSDYSPKPTPLQPHTCSKACNLVGKPVIITRVVDTMVNTPRPTRAEATDVANAVLDGVDGILLGAETLRGKYPVDTVRTVASICRCGGGGRNCGEGVRGCGMVSCWELRR